MVTLDFERQTKELIDSLKGICANAGLGNDGNEFKIITQVFLYKFINDKFAYEAKKVSPSIANAKNWEEALAELPQSEYNKILMSLDADTAELKPEHFITSLWHRQDEGDFAKTFDDTLRDIALLNADIFSVQTEGGSKIKLFDEVSQFVTDESDRDAFCKAIINQLIKFSFEGVFNQKYDFYATIFEYLIKDYNNDSGGTYAEYYTPHAVAKIMASILVPESKQGKINDVTCYDPSAGSGTLLMNIAHAIGEDRCSIYSQDISQKSSGLLRLNLILNNLVHSIPNIIKGNTILDPYHKDGAELKKFDYIVSNPPFKMDFSDYRDDLDTKDNKDRFFAGIPKTKKKDKDKMEIYLLFIQHIMFSLSERGKAAIVLPTGFITAQKGIEYAIREELINKKMLSGVITMPSNIFASTNTSVSILFLSKEENDRIVLIDGSSLGYTHKDGKRERTFLTPDEEESVIDAFTKKQNVEDFAVVVTPEEVRDKSFSFSPSQYFEIKINYEHMTIDDFEMCKALTLEELTTLFNESAALNDSIKSSIKGLSYE
ncbi:TPA: SAM-dependent DNA methyltransferase [Vibrio parahaemolyticus]|nr:SAM-dependent DNA methyltransferase [Vibrio parahaemolyticus]HCH5754760.1 SAM-dependent DNA methyltransferase [Vibrio parahaemolyticus]HCM1523132.1 SAM-dependent DNA methyltransferase [Vibrio parahaemolyticus]HCM1533735.1 SAM-dependent DNA methyltransferase [Vibrio parahaemolyticus]